MLQAVIFRQKFATLTKMSRLYNLGNKLNFVNDVIISSLPKTTIT